MIAGNTGFFLNDEMDDFTTKPGAPNLFGLVQGKKNAIAPGQASAVRMSPTIVAKDGQTFMVIGSPGGSRIITITLETVMNVIDYGLDPQEAVDAPHFHHQWMPDEVFVEPMALSPDTRKLLTDMGYKITEQAPWGTADGDRGHAGSGALARLPLQRRKVRPIQLASARMKPGMIYGANDNRRPAGAAVGILSGGVNGAPSGTERRPVPNAVGHRARSLAPALSSRASRARPGTPRG